MKAVARTKPIGGMNKTEAKYAEHLRLRQLAYGDVQDFWYEGMKLRLADNTSYSPDFIVLRNDGTLEAHEVKGFWRDDARVKWKVAAQIHYYMKFVAVQLVRGEWKMEVYGE